MQGMNTRSFYACSDCCTRQREHNNESHIETADKPVLTVDWKKCRYC